MGESPRPSPTKPGTAGGRIDFTAPTPLNAAARMDNPPRWLTATPLVYGGNLQFWERDAGLLCLGLRELGSDARLVLLGEPAEQRDPPLILGRLEDFKNPAWWSRWNATGVVLNSWGAPRFEPVARAIKHAGLRLVVRLDSNGDKSPRLNFRRYFNFLCCYHLERAQPMPVAASFLKALLYYTVRPAHDGPMCAHVGHANLITIESPLARERFAELLRRLGRADLIGRLRVVPHPVLDAFQFHGGGSKLPVIIAAGRWESPFKDAQKLIRVLGMALSRETTARAQVFGPGADLLHLELARLPDTVRARVSVLGPVPHRDLVPAMQQAQIILCTSRSESFHIASAEGLCCGAAVVGPAEIPSMHWFTAEQSGTLAADRSDARLAEALGEELLAWRSGKRDALRISETWRNRFTARAVAAETLRLLDELTAPSRTC